MTDANRIKNLEQELAHYSLRKFYKTCIRVASQQSLKTSSQKEEIFMNCYQKLSQAFYFTHSHIFSNNLEKQNQKDSSEII